MTQMYFILKNIIEGFFYKWMTSSNKEKAANKSPEQMGTISILFIFPGCWIINARELFAVLMIL